MLTDKELDSARTHLLERKVELEAQLETSSEEVRDLGIEQGDEGGGIGNHNADDASSVAEGERASAVAADLSQMLADVEAALKRVEDGSFGTCQRCGKPIGKERLEAFPYVAYCIDCQTIIERELAMQAGR